MNYRQFFSTFTFYRFLIMVFIYIDIGIGDCFISIDVFSCSSIGGFST